MDEQRGGDSRGVMSAAMTREKGKEEKISSNIHTEFEQDERRSGQRGVILAAGARQGHTLAVTNGFSCHQVKGKTRKVNTRGQSERSEHSFIGMNKEETTQGALFWLLVEHQKRKLTSRRIRETGLGGTNGEAEGSIVRLS